MELGLALSTRQVRRICIVGLPVKSGKGAWEVLGC